MFERDMTADRGERRASGTELVRHGVEDIAQPIDREASLMEVLPDLRQPEHRRAHAARKHIESDKLADRQIAADDELGAEIKGRGDDQLVDRLHRLAGRIIQADDLEARSHVACELLLPAALHLRFDRHGLQRLDPGDALDQEGLILGAAAEFLIEALAKHRRRDHGDSDVKWESGEHDEGQERRIIKHHRQEDECKKKIDNESERRACEKLSYVLKLAHACDLNRQRALPENK